MLESIRKKVQDWFADRRIATLATHTTLSKSTEDELFTQSNLSRCMNVSKFFVIFLWRNMQRFDHVQFPACCSLFICSFRCLKLIYSSIKLLIRMCNLLWTFLFILVLEVDGIFIKSLVLMLMLLWESVIWVITILYQTTT